ncbi:MAG: hypothetical protein Q7U92_14235, partial [Bradyrhizobium sp.]|nr:hypothetical protein [Bradyrhizobium sp.]
QKPPAAGTKTCRRNYHTLAPKKKHLWQACQSRVTNRSCVPMIAASLCVSAAVHPASVHRRTGGLHMLDLYSSPTSHL